MSGRQAFINRVVGPFERTLRRASVPPGGEAVDGFGRALEQLSSSEPEVRLTGICNLERMDWYSEGDRGIVVDALCAFIRERTRISPRTALESAAGSPRPDVDAALAVLARRPRRAGEKARLDLNGAHLEGAGLAAAYLEDANLRDVHLERAYLAGARFQRAHLVNAHLERAFLAQAQLEGAHLNGAHLEEAWLVGANLKGAWLVGAHLEGTHLDRTRGLTAEQLASAHLDDGTILPLHLCAQLRRVRLR